MCLPKYSFRKKMETLGPCFLFNSIGVPSTDPSTESFVEEFFSRLEGAGATTTDSSPASSDAGRGGSDVEDGGGDRRSPHPPADASVPALLGRPVEFSLRLPDWPPREVEQYDLGLRVAAPADPVAGVGEKERQENHFFHKKEKHLFLILSIGTAARTATRAPGKSPRLSFGATATGGSGVASCR